MRIGTKGHRGQRDMYIVPLNYYNIIHIDYPYIQDIIKIIKGKE